MDKETNEAAIADQSIDEIRESLEFGFQALAAGDVPREALSAEWLEVYDLVEEEMSAADMDPSSDNINWQPSERLIAMYNSLA